ncbi:muts protein [Anaeramoeba flamelloides]|uniref:Muts protein n=1 Tax=Anaeramoeba flamelloides TaxID=1746091 RepID=A0ABQ8XUI5_9EUKA|nr:muts protein [Anaeramoeba flamelloides]
MKIGISYICISSPVIFLLEFNDDLQYNYLINEIEKIQPNQIYLSQNIKNDHLTTLLNKEFPKIKKTFFPRKKYNNQNGIQILNRLSIIERNNLEFTLYNKQICFSCIPVLIQMIEQEQDITFSDNTFEIEFKSLEGRIFIDTMTIRNLEIYKNYKTGKIQNSFFSIINFTNTKGGARKLKYEISRPLNNHELINYRLETISELIKNEFFSKKLRGLIKKIGDFDLLVLFLSVMPKDFTLKKVKESIQNLITLKINIELIREIVKILKSFSSNCRFIKQLIINFSHPKLEEIYQLLLKVFVKDITISRKTSEIRNQIVYGIKNGISTFLDLTKKTYTETLEDLNSLFQDIKQKYKIAGMKIQHNKIIGYYISIPINIEELPKEFIHVTRYNKRWHCSTTLLSSLNERIDQSFSEILSLEKDIVLKSIQKIRKKISILHLVSDNLSTLDLLLSLVYLTLSSTDFIKPHFNNKRAFAISQGRNIFKERLKSKSYIPNDTFIDDNNTLQIITGPNMSGKTTYIKQNIYIFILASIGCYIPAKFASFCFIDKIFSKLCNNDLSEKNYSSFMFEMKQTKYILDFATENSFIIFDELGRATDTLNAESLSIVVCEQILKLRSFCLFVTHFSQLSWLEQIYHSIKTFHFQIKHNYNQNNHDENKSEIYDVEEKDDNNEKENFHNNNNHQNVLQYRIKEGCSLDNNQAINLASMIFPKSIILKSNQNFESIIQNKSLHKNLIIQNLSSKINYKTINEISTILRSIESSSLNKNTLKSYLIQLQKQCKQNILQQKKLLD